MACRRQAIDAKRQLLAFGKSKVNPLSTATHQSNGKLSHAFCRAQLEVEGLCNAFSEGNYKKCESYAKCHSSSGSISNRSSTSTSSDILCIFTLFVIPTRAGWPLQCFLSVL